MARPVTAFDPDVLEEICKLVCGGCSIGPAAMSKGVNPGTLREWAQRGRTDPETYPQYAELAHTLEVAHAQRTVTREQLIMLAAHSGDWKAAMALESAQNPRQYGDASKPLPEAHEAPPGMLMGEEAPASVDLRSLSQEARDELRQALRNGASGSDGSGPRQGGRAREPARLRASNDAGIPGELAPQGDRS